MGEKRRDNQERTKGNVKAPRTKSKNRNNNNPTHHPLVGRFLKQPKRGGTTISGVVKRVRENVLVFNLKVKENLVLPSGPTAISIVKELQETDLIPFTDGETHATSVPCR